MTESPELLLSPKRRYINSILKNWQLYLFLLPAVLNFAFFTYAPMYGIQLAFKDLSMRAGITRSPWASPHWYSHFERFMTGHMFWTLIQNTIIISLYGLLAGFPIPIILALMLNECKNKRFMKIVQNVTYAPTFISTVIIVGMIRLFFMQNGIINQLLALLNIQGTDWLMRGDIFRHLFVWTGIWQGMGMSSVIYFAALAGVPPDLHEAAIIDGATRIQRMWHVSIPWILPTIVILFILASAGIMTVGFERIFLMQNGLNIRVSEVISTYVFKLGVERRDYSLGAAVGLFNNVINMILLFTVNAIAKRVSDISLF